jgi:hypothetical protein
MWRQTIFQSVSKSVSTGRSSFVPSVRPHPPQRVALEWNRHEHMANVTDQDSVDDVASGHSTAGHHDGILSSHTLRRAVFDISLPSTCSKKPQTDPRRHVEPQPPQPTTLVAVVLGPTPWSGMADFGGFHEHRRGRSVHQWDLVGRGSVAHCPHSHDIAP